MITSLRAALIEAVETLESKISHRIQGQETRRSSSRRWQINLHQLFQRRKTIRWQFIDKGQGVSTISP